MKIDEKQILRLFLNFVVLFSSVDASNECDETFQGGKFLIRRMEEIGKRSINVEKTGMNSKKLEFYCYAGTPASYLTIWKRVVLKLTQKTDAPLKLYKAPSASEVYDKYMNDTTSWIGLWRKIPGVRTVVDPFVRNGVGLDAFDANYVIVSSESTYEITLQSTRLEPMFIAMVAVGFVLFFSAAKLSRNALFYYSTGIGIGIIASILILLYVMSRFIPKKSVGLLVALYVGGVSTFFSIPMYIYIHGLGWVVDNYLIYAITYVVSAAVFSFAFLYWRGPIDNERTLTILMWFVQIFSLTLIYNGIQVKHVAVCVVVTAVLVYNSPRGVFNWIRQKWAMRFPKSRRLLTGEEYYLEGRAETRKALEELRQYCRSPQCDTWRTVSRLDSPSRFAKFVSGDLHVTRDEVEAYDSDAMNGEISRDLDLDNEDEVDFTLNTS
ncbi:nuclear envelope integral membrane protein 1-like [Tubulanus polymorphus]|uniref:nuclear envelope integral membrane protein 1-like n=1 Tax=Tubulanus polymorphus TaxID=672921 RepID=UPI003DA4FBC9